jgi:hypothetical protein
MRRAHCNGVYNSNGSLDTTFGSGGTELITIFGGAPNAIVELTNGDLMTIAGSVLAQFNSNGVLQTAVTGGTIVAASAGGTNVFQPDGRSLLVQGATDIFDSVDHDIQVVRSWPPKAWTGDSTIRPLTLVRQPWWFSRMARF